MGGTEGPWCSTTTQSCRTQAVRANQHGKPPHIQVSGFPKQAWSHHFSFMKDLL